MENNYVSFATEFCCLLNLLLLPHFSLHERTILAIIYWAMKIILIFNLKTSLPKKLPGGPVGTLLQIKHVHYIVGHH